MYEVIKVTVRVTQVSGPVCPVSFTGTIFSIHQKSGVKTIETTRPNGRASRTEKMIVIHFSLQAVVNFFIAITPQYYSGYILPKLSLKCHKNLGKY
jgi:hypothetical protein